MKGRSLLPRRVRTLEKMRVKIHKSFFTKEPENFGELIQE